MFAPAAAAAAEKGNADKEENDHVDASQLTLDPVDERLTKAVDVKTGEEDEDILFKGRSRLLKFCDEDTYGDEVRKNFWKERGKGEVKVLKHNKTGACRVLMRQEKTHKICLNFVVSGGAADPQQSGEKAWLYTAFDFADHGDEGEFYKFASRFASKNRDQVFRGVQSRACRQRRARGRDAYRSGGTTCGCQDSCRYSNSGGR